VAAVVYQNCPRLAFPLLNLFIVSYSIMPNTHVNSDEQNEEEYATLGFDTAAKVHCIVQDLCPQLVQRDVEMFKASTA
jgi:hypothetical protein